MSVAATGDVRLRIAAHAFAATSQQIAVAVSGGSDSMAALLLMVQAGRDVLAVTVDHRLRAEATEEARHVGRVCAAMGVPHHVLVWHHGPLSGNLMDAARRARYALVAEWALGQGIGDVVLGHTADDQAETFLMGLARGTGLDGLVGMRAQWVQGGVTFRRPFLDIPRADLRACLAAQGVAWVDDPTNGDDRFARVKARRALQALKPMGITVDRLGLTIQNLRMVQGAVMQAMADTLDRIGQQLAGAIALERSGFAVLGPELQHRLLATCLRWMSGADHPPRADGIARLRAAIQDGRDVTLSGCRIRVSDATIRILREPRAVATAETPTTGLWDNRWRMDGPHAEDLTIRAVGTDGLRQCPVWRDSGVPRDTLMVAPAIWRGATLIAAPVAGKSAGWSATMPQSLRSFILSH